MIISQIIIPYRLELHYIENRWTKSKNDTDANPLGGMVNSLERAYSKRFLFLLAAIKISETEINPLGP